MDDLDPVWKALSDPTRRAILDRLRQGARTTTEIVSSFPQLSRFGVMKHLDVLRRAHLIQTRASGRLRVNSLNTVPIRQIYERWVSRFEEEWAHQLLRVKEGAERGERSSTGDAARPRGESTHRVTNRSGGTSPRLAKTRPGEKKGPAR